MTTSPSASDNAEAERLRRICDLLRQAERPVRVLRTVAWSPSVRESFFATGARELPRVEYPTFDPSPTLEALTAARTLLRPEGVIDDWLSRQADAIGGGARMLAGIGTPELYRWSRKLYGGPEDPIADGVSTTLDLARQLIAILEGLDDVDLGAPDPACHLAQGVADRIRAAVEKEFGDRAPQVVVVDQLSANALAGPSAIRIRRNACFTDRDVYQLIHHEALVHVATSLNGREQVDLPILAAGHPGTTRTQEGLAVFAELMSGTLDPDRLKRLVLRVLAIQMAVDGADFLEVYRYFADQGIEREQAFESTRRVFRGGVLAGGAPFTKDCVYLGGLLRVHNFLRAAVAAGRSDCLRLLFCGKLDIEDVPALCQLSHQGLCRPPRFVPPWIRDLRFLVSYLAYSAFLNRVSLDRIREHYAMMLAAAPRLDPVRD